MALSYHCQNCGADLVFDADSQQMYCQHCGSKIVLESVVPIDPANAAIYHAEDWQEEEAVQFVCSSCGAAIITDKNTTATFCLFCGNSAVISERLSGLDRPNLVIPFSYGREVAEEKFLRWCKSGRMTPKDFVSKANIEKITGLYVPYWLFDCQVQMDMEATGTIVSKETDLIQTNQVTTQYKIIRKRQLFWEKIPHDGASQIDDQIMHVLEPFNYEESKGFDMKYLAGFFAEKYDITSETLQPIIQDQIEDYLKGVFNDSVAEYSKVSIKSDRSEISKFTSIYALLPVWFLTYRYHGKTYTFAMNGQTGKVAGQPPISPPKVSGSAALSLAAFALVGYLLFLFLAAIFFPPLDKGVNGKNSGVYDYANLLSISEIDNLETQAQKLSLAQDINVYFVTTDYKSRGSYPNTNKGSQDYAQKLYKDLMGYNPNDPKQDYAGFLVLLDMETRYLYICTAQRIHQVVSDRTCTTITDSMVNSLRKAQYAQVGKNVFSKMEAAILNGTESYARNRQITFVITTIILPLLLTVITIIWLTHHKKSQITVDRYSYLGKEGRKGNPTSNQDDDVFISRTVIPIRSSTGGGSWGSGGGGFSSGGGGGSFGGGGSNF